jgi:hypothetical protein
VVDDEALWPLEKWLGERGGRVFPENRARGADRICVCSRDRNIETKRRTNAEDKEIAETEVV